MRIYQQTSEDKLGVIQANLQRHFLPSDTWGIIDTSTSPEQAAQDFRAAILSDAAAEEQAAFELLSQRFQDKYGHAVPAGDGKTLFSVFPAAAGARILFVTNYAQRPVKKVFTGNTMGEGMKIHTRKIRNHFEPERWRRESWFFVAYALRTGNETEFKPIGRYS